MFVNVGWAACAYLVTRILAASDPRFWLAAGAVTGLAFEGKHSMALFAAALVAGLLATRQRRLLRDRWFWAGVTIAVLIALPNVAWEIAHGWPTVELLSNIAHSSKNVELGPLEYLLTNVADLSPITLPLWGRACSGARSIAEADASVRSPSHGRSPSPSSSYSKARATTSRRCLRRCSPLAPVTIESWIVRRPATARRAWRIGVIAALLAGCLPLWPFAMPMLPVGRFLAYQRALHLAPPRTETQPLGELPQQYAVMFGWPELATAVAR